jgi:hypothetical protein
VPSRYTILLALSIPVLCGAALADLTRRAGRWRTWIAGVIVAAAAVDGLKVGNRNSADRDGGQLAVELPRGVYRFELYYRPRTFVVGTLVTLTTLGLVVALLIERRRRTWARRITGRESGAS